MILLHRLDAPYDIPGLRIRRGEAMYHLLSTRPGHAGTAEALSFGRQIGAHDAWLQGAGTYREHFDLFGQWADLALRLGARPASNREVAEALARKRAATEGWAEAIPAITSRQMAAVRALLASTPGYDIEQAVTFAGLKAEALTRQLLNTDQSTLPTVAIVAGPGRTGQVGLVAARALALGGYPIRLWRVTAGGAAPPLAESDRLRPLMHSYLPTTADLADVALIIDALLGDGLAGPPRGALAAAIQAINAAARPVLAIDLPSGLDADEDGPRDPSVRATATLALGVPCRALTLWASAPYVGDLWLAPLGIPRRVVKQVGAHPGSGFASASQIHLQREPIAGTLLASPVSVLRIA